MGGPHIESLVNVHCLDWSMREYAECDDFFRRYEARIVKYD